MGNFNDRIRKAGGSIITGSCDPYKGMYRYNILVMPNQNLDGTDLMSDIQEQGYDLLENKEIREKIVEVHAADIKHGIPEDTILFFKYL